MSYIPADPSNYTAGRTASVQHLVNHYTGNDGDTAEGNASYFSHPNENNLSAHYFVDEYGWFGSVPEEDTAHHCSTINPRIKNNNSIGIEWCSRRAEDGTYYFHPQTIANAVALNKILLKNYNLPVENVWRHFDVTGKNCPAPLVQDESKWWQFKAMLMEDEMQSIIERIAQVAGLTTEETIVALGTLAKFANTTTEDWEVSGEAVLRGMGIITSQRDPRELVEFGEFGTILSRFKDKYIK